MVDLHIKNGTVVTPAGQFSADVLVEDGKVSGLIAAGSKAEARQVIDATGLHVLPGVIDPHIHLQNRGKTFTESCATFSRTQVSGGTTSALSFIFAPQTSYIPVLEDMTRAVAEHSIIDMGATPMLQTRLHLDEMAELSERHGIGSYKVFPFNAGNHMPYPGTVTVDDGFVWLAMRKLAAMNPKPLLQVHAENWEIADALTAELKAAGRTDAAAWTEARPNICEEDSVRQFSFWIGKANIAGYCVHLTTREAPKLIADARSRGIHLYGETCPQYLSSYDTHPRAAMAKYQPSIKSKEDMEALWAGLRDGWIHCLGSDHIAVAKSDKNLDKDIWGVGGALPNSGTILPVMLHHGVSARRLGIEDVVRTCSYNTARIFGLYPRKGHLNPGADADIVLVDLKRQVTVTPELLNVDFTLYDGERFTGWPRVTIVGGRVVCEDGTIAVPVSGGRMLARQAPRWPVVV